MVPIYATVSFLSFLFYRHSIYFEVIRDCYEAFAMASFFALLCHYIAPDLHNQKDYFRGVRPVNWVWPMGWCQRCTGGENQGLLRRPRSGLTWFNVIYFGVFQYCFIRVFMTIVAVASQAAGRYCLESLHPAFAHIWVMVIEGGCVTIAMYCLIQFYVQLREDLAEHRPLLKVTAIKLVIFLSFWQTILISFLTSSGAVKPSKRFDFPDIKVGIPSMLLCIEMAVFAIFHLWAFPWTVYDVRRSPIVAAESAAGFLPDPKTAYQGGRFGQVALMDAFNPWDLIKAVGRGFRWFAIGRRIREQDISYKTHHYLHHNHNVGLEPTRNSPAYRPSHSFEETHPADPYAPTTTPSTSMGSKSAHYRAVFEHDQDAAYDDPNNDHHGLISHAQPQSLSTPPVPSAKFPSSHSYTEGGNASSDTLPYPRPMIRYPTPPRSSGKKPQRISDGAESGGGGDIGAPGFYADEDPPPLQQQQQFSTPAQMYEREHPTTLKKERDRRRDRSQSPSSIPSHHTKGNRSHHRDPSSFDDSHSRPTNHPPPQAHKPSPPTRIRTPPPAPAYLYSDPDDPPGHDSHPYHHHHRPQSSNDGGWNMWDGATTRRSDGDDHHHHHHHEEHDRI